MLLKEKCAVITGADRGIGKAIALSFGREGAKVVVGYRSGKDRAEEVVSQIGSMGGEAKAIYVDVSQKESVDAFVEESMGYLGRIDVLVNNAGITKDNLLARMTEEEWDAVLTVNLKSAFLTTKGFSKYMTKQKSGSIIQMASVIGEMGNIGQANYAASKAGLIGFTKTAAQEVARKNVRVNAIAPGFIQTEMTEVIDEGKKELFYDRIPLKRAGTTEDVANMAIFLASDLSSYVTGQVLNVDGGMVMQG